MVLKAHLDRNLASWDVILMVKVRKFEEVVVACSNNISKGL